MNFDKRFAVIQFAHQMGQNPTPIETAVEDVLLNLGIYGRSQVTIEEKGGHGNDKWFRSGVFDNRNLPSGTKTISSGLTKREWFAGLAMQGFITASDPKIEWLKIPHLAVTYADHLIAELNKTDLK